MKFLILSLMIFISTNSFAENKILVTKIIGQATVLKPHSHNAEPVVLGQSIPEDSSILTQEKSVVQVKFPDGSTVNLGPNSKMVLEFIKNESQPNFLSLLKGMIRAKVVKDHPKEQNTQSKEKFIIKSRGASLGVRGTEFQIGVNEDQSTTSLLTFEGVVEFSNKPITKEEIKENKAISIVKGELVSKGQFSNVKEEKTKVSQILKPVEIDATQFQILAKNENLQPIEKTQNTIYETNKPVIDFESGKVIKDNNVKMDSSGKIIDERLKHQELKEVVLVPSKKYNLNISLENSWNFYQVKHDGNSYYIHNSQQNVQIESKLDFGYLISGMSFLNQPTISHSKYQYNINSSNFSADQLLYLKVLSNKKSFAFGQYQYGIGFFPKTFYKVDDMNNLVNSTESAPSASFNLYFNHPNNISSFIKTNASMIDMDKLGIDSSIGLSKKFNDFNIGVSVGVESIKEQKSESISLNLGLDF